MAEFKPVLLSLQSSFTPSLALEVCSRQPQIVLAELMHLVQILPHGLTLHRIIVQADGRTHDVVIGPELPKDHVSQKYTNSIVGRYSNRIPVGTHILERHGIKSEFVAQANGDEAELSHLSSPTTDHAIFRLISPDGNQGFPGKLILEALVAIIGPGKQERKYRTTTDIPQAVGPEYDLGSIVLTYRAKLDEEKKSDRIAELGPDALPTGAFLLAKDHPSHAHSAKRIGDLFPEKGYDDFYLLQNPGSSQFPTRLPLSSFNSKLDLIKDIIQPSNDEQGKPTRGNRPEPVVELSSEKSGIKLVFDTNRTSQPSILQPRTRITFETERGVMFYSNTFGNPASGARKKIHGGSGISGHGDSYGSATAVFLEFHEPLAAFLDPKNKNGDDTLITNDELYHNYVRCDVRFKEVDVAE
ncbi:hypothetical protein DXG03_006909 [Asterophora parasitica]|uniref:Uncharacterized protein n=1 Tax=Asterophora parasitica TaxID=117018 RepID=A0A9P7G981_9AGAR|nr:hypothetical protein DXG03_006909 [Asterophora parasitica]